MNTELWTDDRTVVLTRDDLRAMNVLAGIGEDTWTPTPTKWDTMTDDEIRRACR